MSTGEFDRTQYKPEKTKQMDSGFRSVSFGSRQFNICARLFVQRIMCFAHGSNNLLQASARFQKGLNKLSRQFVVSKIRSGSGQCRSKSGSGYRRSKITEQQNKRHSQNKNIKSKSSLEQTAQQFNVSNKQPNKALHPTAYSLRSFARASLRHSGFRRRVSLIVVLLHAAWSDVLHFKYGKEKESR